MDPNWQKIKVRIIFGNLSVALPEPKQQVECAIKFFFFFLCETFIFQQVFSFRFILYRTLFSNNRTFVSKWNKRTFFVFSFLNSFDFPTVLIQLLWFPISKEPKGSTQNDIVVFFCFFFYFMSQPVCMRFFPLNFCLKNSN